MVCAGRGVGRGGGGNGAGTRARARVCGCVGVWACVRGGGGVNKTVRVRAEVGGWMDEGSARPAFIRFGSAGYLRVKRKRC